MVEVLLLLGLGPDDPAERGAAGRGLAGAALGRGLAEAGLDLVLDLVRQLAATAGEELDPVVPGRVVAGRQDHAEVRIQGFDQVGDARRGQHPEAEHVHPGAGQPGHHGRLQELAGGAGIAADHGHRPPGPGCGEDLGGRHREVQGQLGRELTACYATYTVRTEESAHGSRSPSAKVQPNEKPASACRAGGLRVISAWSTEAPCGPS